MASFKITDLTELTGGSVADTDVLEIVDLDQDQSKKVTIASLKTVFSASEGSSYTGGTSNGIMFNDGDTFATNSDLTYSNNELTLFATSPNSPKITMQRSGGGAMQISVANGRLSVGGSGQSPAFYVLSRDTGFNAQTPQAQVHITGYTDKVSQRIDLSNGQTADAFQINSFGNTGGDLFKVEDDGSFGNGSNGFFYKKGSTRYTSYSGLNLGGGIYMSFPSTGRDVFGLYVSNTSNLYMYWNSGGNINTRGSLLLGASSHAAVLSGPDASAQLDIRSTTKGALLPRMTTTQRDAISSPANGLLIYNTTANQFQYYNSGLASWTAV